MDSETALCKRPMIISAPPVSQMCQRIGMMEAQPTVYKHLAAISVLHASQEFEMGGELCHLGRTTDTRTVLCGHSVVIPNKLISHMCGCGGRLGILFHVRWCTAAITAPPVLKMCLRTGMADARNVVWKRPMAILAHFVSQTCQRGGVAEAQPTVCLHHVASSALDGSRVSQGAEMCCRNTFKEKPQVPMLLCVGIVLLSQRGLCCIRVKLEDYWGVSLMYAVALRLLH